MQSILFLYILPLPLQISLFDAVIFDRVRLIFGIALNDESFHYRKYRFLCIIFPCARMKNGMVEVPCAVDSTNIVQIVNGLHFVGMSSQPCDTCDPHIRCSHLLGSLIIYLHPLLITSALIIASIIASIAIDLFVHETRYNTALPNIRFLSFPSLPKFSCAPVEKITFHRIAISRS